MKGIDHSYYYEGYTAFKAEEVYFFAAYCPTNQFIVVIRAKIANKLWVLVCSITDRRILYVQQVYNLLK